jgi:nucleotide-binding universal stress UspA family protein
MRDETILFPTDFSDSADEALDTVASVARSLKARLHVFHAIVLETPFVVPADGAAAVPLPDDLLGQLERQASHQLEQAATRVRAHSVEVSTEWRRGNNAVDSILQYAEEIQADLVVMSSHGRRGFRRFLVGSVTEEVVRRAHCPALVIRRDPELKPPSASSRIVAAVDLSEHSEAVLSAARVLAASLVRDLDLLHVVNTPGSSTMAVGATPFGPVSTAPLDSVSEEERLQRSRALLEQAFARARGPEIEARAVVRSGKPEDEIVAHAEETGASLIVVGTEGHSGVSRLLLGSVCERVLRRAPCAVYVVPHRGTRG